MSKRRRQALTADSFMLAAVMRCASVCSGHMLCMLCCASSLEEVCAYVQPHVACAAGELRHDITWIALPLHPLFQRQRSGARACSRRAWKFASSGSLHVVGHLDRLGKIPQRLCRATEKLVVELVVLQRREQQLAAAALLDEG